MSDGHERAVVHMDRSLAMAVNLFILSTALAVCLVLLLVKTGRFPPAGLRSGRIRFLANCDRLSWQTYTG